MINNLAYKMSENSEKGHQKLTSSNSKQDKPTLQIFRFIRFKILLDSREIAALVFLKNVLDS